MIEVASWIFLETFAKDEVFTAETTEGRRNSITCAIHICQWVVVIIYDLSIFFIIEVISIIWSIISWIKVIIVVFISSLWNVGGERSDGSGDSDSRLMLANDGLNCWLWSSLLWSFGCRKGELIWCNSPCVTNVFVGYRCQFGVKVLTGFALSTCFHEFCSDEFYCWSIALYFDRSSFRHCWIASFWEPREINQSAIWPGLSRVPYPETGIFCDKQRYYLDLAKSRGRIGSIAGQQCLYQLSILCK